MSKPLLSTLLALSVSLPAFSQASQLPCAPSIGSPAAMQAVLRKGSGSPYSLTATIKTSWKLSDGNTLNGFTTSRQIRDTLGRTRVDNPMSCVWDKDHQPQWQGMIEVEDPVAETRTRWTEGQGAAFKTATVRHDPPATFRAGNPITARDELRTAQSLAVRNPHAGPLDDQYKVEDLGKREIAGLEASGLRTTRTQPAGAWGNSLPIDYVEEKWISEQYGIILKYVVSNPVLGDTAYEVTSFTVGEPDASLFQPPADYEVKNQ